MPSNRALRSLIWACWIVAAVLAGIIWTRPTPKGRIDWDWPLIAAYTLAFLLAALLHMRNQRPRLALVLVVAAAATTILDTAENLANYEGTAPPAVVAGKFLCFFIALVMMLLPWLCARLLPAHT